MTAFSTDDDIHYLQRCFILAQAARYTARPNPAVGCVIVKNGQVVGEGYTQPPGHAHAEIMALREAQDAARGATVYVSLEPCAHQGRTGPCCEALIGAGVARVVYALGDPNPLVSGKGLARLREAGIEVSGPFLQEEAAALNPGFIKRMKAGLPYVRCKVGMSLDARTAMASGESQWITGSEARADVQEWRARSCAILSGIGTVLADDPSLNVRLPNFTGAQPLRVILDSQARLPAATRLLQLPGKVLQVGLAPPPAAPLNVVADWEYRQLPSPPGQGGVDLHALLRMLARDYCCNEILVEAGATLTGALLQANLVDELLTYIAPVLLGHQARPMALLEGVQRLDQGLGFTFADVVMLGKDCRIRCLAANRAV
ncbi:MAG: bifunctional diaminohydroxyphosphoribosylaminopyrimidine deaminase/5-amino-6-(5-phosphoribosylamino)uracil reductase RibD [Pseudomonadales bacterium]|nr:bifunctional diaminohydroxyphosphoribosylaminopyrimidine deaminase/5-amino-6-(5-phosphoribosylamino)uracil reductase RibD [Pseudomonadales bacterium]